jgi:molybdopterin converting factor subunit 1
MSTDLIKVKILFFGAAAEIAGKRDDEMMFSAGTDSGSALNKILAADPAFTESFKNSLLFAVNQEYAAGDEILRDGDELALIPPVSGG